MNISNIDVFFKDLKALEIDWDFVDTIPEFHKLKECQQNPKWHGEGNAYAHTRACVEAAHKLLTDSTTALDPYEKNLLMVGVLFHDIGKANTTEFLKGNWHAYGHECVGERIARRILWNVPIYFRESICSMIRWHMEVLNVATGKDYLNRIAKMSQNRFFSWRDVLFVKRCDILGSKPEDETVTNKNINQLFWLNSVIVQMGCRQRAFCDSNFDAARLFNRPVSWGPETFGLPESASEITVLIGLPGAGKDTYITRLREDIGTESFDKEYRVLCRDDIRAELGYCKEGEKIIGTDAEERAVSELFDERLKEYTSRGLNVIINNLNVRKRYRDDYKRLVGVNAIWRYVYIEAPTLEDNISRRDGQISPEVFKGIIEKFDWPTADEYDTFLYYKQNKLKI